MWRYAFHKIPAEKRGVIMSNCKLMAIIIATAVATAAAVVFLMQKQNERRRKPFDDDLFDDDFELGENIDLPDDIDEGEEDFSMIDNAFNDLDDITSGIEASVEKAEDAVSED